MRHSFLPRRALHALAALAFVTATHASAQTLSPATSAELQALLGAQVKKAAVHFHENSMPSQPQSTYERLWAWNEVAMDTTAIDHTPVPAGATYIFGQQFGPHRASRAMAIAHIAMFEAVNAVYQKYQSYAGVAAVSGNVSVDYAIAQAGHDALVWLYPSQKPRLDGILAADLATITGDPAALANGKALGQAAAAAIIALRTNDGSNTTEPVVGVNFFPKTGPGYWSPDPVSGVKVALGANWNQVKPFVMTSAAQFRPLPPPALNSVQYTLAYYQVAAVGGDPANGTPTVRTRQETMQGIFWTYDGVPQYLRPGAAV